MCIFIQAVSEDENRHSLSVAYDLDGRTLAAELHDRLVQCTHRGDAPEVGAAHVDVNLVDDLLVVEGIGEAVDTRDEHLPNSLIRANAPLLLCDLLNKL